MTNSFNQLNEQDQQKLLNIRNRLAQNEEARSILEALVHNFLQQPNRKSLSNFLDALEFSGENGLLKTIEEQLELQGKKITFDIINQENISLQHIINGEWTFSAQSLSDDLRNIGPLGEDVEKYISKIFLDKLRLNLSQPLFTELKQRVNTNDTLATRCFQIQGFLEEYSEETKHINLNTINISNQAIANYLEKEGKIDKDKTRTLTQPEFKKIMDVLVSREMTPRIKEYGQAFIETEQDIKNTIQNSFPLLWTISAVFPYKPKELRKNPWLNNKLIQLENKLTKSTSPEDKQNIQSQMQTLYREAYKEEIKKSDPHLANTLQILRDNDFDYSKLSPEQLQSLIEKTTNQRIETAIKRGFSRELREEKTLEQFIKDLSDPSKTEIKIGSMIIPVNKILRSKTNPHLKDINSRSEKDHFPYEFEIDIDNIDGGHQSNKETVKVMLQQLGIGNEEDNTTINGKATIPGEKIGAFIWLFLWEHRTDRQKNDEDWLSLEEKEERKNTKSNLLDNHKEKESDITAFEDNWNKLQGYNFKNDENTNTPGFRPGTKLMVAYGSSSLPPYETGAQDRLEMSIEKINSNEGWFEVKIKGSTLSIGNQFEGKTQRFKMNWETLAHFQKFGTVLKLPNPQDSTSPQEHLQKLKGISTLSKGLSAFDPLEWDDSKKGWLNRFVNDDNEKWEKEKVEYFWYQDRSYEWGKPDKRNIVYKVKYSPNSKTFKVENEGFFNKNEKKKDTYTKRDKEMDYNSFLLFIADLKLQPRKKSEAEDAQKRNDEKAAQVYNNTTRNRFRASFGTVKNVLKGQFKKINEKLEGYTKGQQQRFEDFLIDDFGLYNIVGKTLGWIPSVNDAIGWLQQERFSEKDNRVRKNIEGIMKGIEADPRFTDMFEEQPDFIHTLFGGKSYRQFLVDGFNSPNGYEPPALYLAAALLLVNIKAGKSPYRWLSEYENSGMWVKTLLGKTHYDNFLSQKQQLLDDLKSWKANEDQLLDKLSRCEVEYITNTVNGIPWWQNWSFWSIESRGNFPDGKPGYIDNPSKNRLSGKFAGELWDRYNAWNSKNAIEETYNKISHNDFDLAKNDFDKIKSGRFIVAMANLKKMGTLAKTDGQKQIFKQCMITSLLSWEINTYGDKSTHKWFYTMARSFNFAPGFFANKFKHQQYTITLLNKATNGNFEKEINKLLNSDEEIKKLQGKGEIDNPYTLENFNPLSKNTQIGILNKAIGKRRNDGDNYQKIEKFCSPWGKLANTDWTQPENEDPDGIMQSFKIKLFDSSLEDTDRDILDNDNLSNDVGLLASKSIVEKRLRYKNGEFISQSNDPNEIEAKKDFWNKVTSNLNKATPEVAMKQFLIFFDAMGFSEYQKERIVESIKTASVYKEKAGQKAPTIKDRRTQKEHEMGYIRENDWKNILWYTFKGAVIESGGNPPTELDQTLDKFLEVFSKDIEESKGENIIKAFGNYNDTKPLRLIWREYYNSLFGSKSEENEWMRDYLDQGGNKEQKEIRRQRQEEKDFFRSNSNLFINEDMRRRERMLRDRFKYTAPNLWTGISEEDIEEIYEAA